MFQDFVVSICMVLAIALKFPDLGFSYATHWLSLLGRTNYLTS